MTNAKNSMLFWITTFAYLWNNKEAGFKCTLLQLGWFPATHIVHLVPAQEEEICVISHAIIYPSKVKVQTKMNTFLSLSMKVILL